MGTSKDVLIEKIHDLEEPKYYVLGIWGDVEPLPLQGPFDTEEERDLKAREMKKNDDVGEGGIYRLNVIGGIPTVECYSHLELNPDDEDGK